MLDKIKELLGLSNGKNADLYKNLVSDGAIIIDVRSPEEFASGHIDGARNYPLSHLDSQMSKLNKNKKIITCCMSGRRSEMARRTLADKGYEVYNGGSWRRLNKMLS